MDWIPFDQDRYAQQPLPIARRHVLVQLTKDEQGSPPAVVVGYMRFAAGDPNSPTFTTPGVSQRNRKVVAWCDCLPSPFNAPLWRWGSENPCAAVAKEIEALNAEHRAFLDSLKPPASPE